MSENDGSRRVMAEIRTGQDQTAITQIGSRSIHHFWQLLAPDFQGIFLAPQRRPDDGGVVWSWREPAGNKPVTPVELAELRQRLMAAGRSLAKNLEGSESGPETMGGIGAKESIDQLRSKVTEMVTKLSGRSDAKLMAFACRTDGGVMLHSWGASVAARPFYPDARDCEISGTVLVGEKGAPDFEVVIESRTGAHLARTRSDASGQFRLQKIGPGTHRVRVISDRVDFPVSGVMVTVERTSIANLELRSTSGTVASGMVSQASLLGSSERTAVSMKEEDMDIKTPGGRTAPRRRWWWGVVFVTGALAVAGGSWWIWSWSRTGDRRLDSGASESSFSGGLLAAHDGADRSAPGSRLADSGRRPSGAAAASLAAPPMSGLGPLNLKRSASAESSATESPPPKSVDGKGKAPTADHPERHAVSEKSHSEATDKPDNATNATSVANEAPLDARQTVAAADAAVSEKPEAPSDSAKSARGGKTSKPVRDAQGKPSGDLPEGETVEPSLPESTRDDAVDADRAQDRPAAARAKSGGAKSGNVSPENSIPVLPVDGTSVAESDETEDASGANVGSGRAEGGAKMRSGSALPNVGTGQKTPSIAAPEEAKGTPMSVDESPNQTSGSDPRAPGFGASAAAENGQRASQTPRVSSPMSPSGESAVQAGSPDVEADDAERATTPGHQAEKARAKPKPNQTERPPSAATAASVDVETRGAVETMDSPPNKQRGRVEPDTKGKGREGPVPNASSAAGRSREQPVEETEQAPQGTASISKDVPRGVSTGDAGMGVRLSRKAYIRISAWHPQLIQDVILPTQPVRAGEDDAIERLREQYFKERQRQIPASFKSPVLWNGCALEVPPADMAVGNLRWSESTNTEVRGTTIVGARAEIAWSGGTPPVDGRYVLSRRDGRKIAEIIVDKGGVAVRAASQVRCWYWAAFEPAAVDLADFTAGQPARFGWQLSQGARLPDASRIDDQWRGGRTQRLDLPVDLSENAVRNKFDVVLVDRISGWAIGSQIDETQAPVAAW